MSDAPHYTGTLRRGEEAGTVVGELIDTFGWRIHITGNRLEDGSYVLRAVVGNKGRLTMSFDQEVT